ncbi:hypothetical protein [Methanococcus voltae]|uniref:Uncharacterized protein n=1 Tax=Methanococcus voltae (strain ATCC BAA-1334 / A3) TaxID=456320 RepID=D7DSU8_METV3|nr:hypothetical protein [Methanococcus voltae]MCS3901808.1 hypothetical protein [Methanococcus voltae]
MQYIKDELKEISSGKETIFGSLENTRCARVLLGKFDLDEEVHHPNETRSCYTQKEIRESINLVKEFIKEVDSIKKEVEKNKLKEKLGKYKKIK